MNIQADLKKVVSRTFDIKNVVAVICAVGAITAALYFVGLGFSSIYFPLRLYFTGYTGDCTISSVDAVMATDGDGFNEYVDYFVLGCDGIDGEVIADPKYQGFLGAGKHVRIFYSNIIREGFVTRDKSISPYDVLVDYGKYKPALVLIVLCLLFIPLLLSSWSLARARFVQIANKEIESRNAALEPFKKHLIITRLFVSYSVLIVFIYLIGGLMLKALLTMESDYKLLAGLFIFGSLMILLFMPYLVFRIRDGMETNPMAENIFSVLKILAGIYGSVKTFQFVQHDLSNYENIKLVLEDFVIFLFSP